MNGRDRILVVEDERSISGFIRAILTSNGYEVVITRDGADAISQISLRSPDLVLLDLGLPDMDGLEIIKNLRQWTQLPIMVVSARSYEHDKVAALDSGADDYLTKPFGAGELIARVKVALRHTHASLSAEPLACTGCYSFGGLTIDYDKHQVYVDGENVHLTQNEYKIVALLGKCPGKVLTYDFIIKELWGSQGKGSNQILRVNMANIRRKLEKNPGDPQYILTEVGVGYRLKDGE